MISSCCTAEAFSVWNSTVQLVSIELTGGGAAGAMAPPPPPGCCYTPTGGSCGGTVLEATGRLRAPCWSLVRRARVDRRARTTDTTTGSGRLCVGVGLG